jgi:hypothetical protein
LRSTNAFSLKVFKDELFLLNKALNKEISLPKKLNLVLESIFEKSKIGCQARITI